MNKHDRFILGRISHKFRQHEDHEGNQNLHNEILKMIDPDQPEFVQFTDASHFTNIHTAFNITNSSIMQYLSEKQAQTIES